MNLLVLGGTKFVGRHIAHAALDAGAAVTLFHRGQTQAPELANCEHVYGDRTSDLHRVGSRTWDAVIDTSAYTPGVAQTAARFFDDKTARYVFISTISVYDVANAPQSVDEDAPLQRLPATWNPAEFAVEQYGALKALCEEVMLSTLRSRVTVLRPGLVAGPYDPTDRFTAWPLRVDAGGSVLAPPAQDPIRYIDARDLAAFTVRVASGGSGGIYNCVTAPGEYRFCDLLDACLHAAASGAQVTYAGAERLLGDGIRPWIDMPLWIPQDAPESALLRISNGRALVRGLRTRDIAETVRDTLAWARAAGKHA